MDDAKLIKESAEELLSLEPQQKQAMLRDGVRFVRLLKTGQAHTQIVAGEQIGLKQRQSQPLWHTYRQKGIQG